MELNPPQNNLLGVASKKLIDLLLKRKIVLISVVAGIVLFFILIFAATSNSSGVNDYQYSEQLSKKCSNNITIEYIPYDTMQTTTTTMNLEDYIAAAVYAYTKDIKNLDENGSHLYKALALALRNEALSNNCTVTYHDKEITPLNTSTDQGKEISKALSNIKDVVVTYKGSSDLLPIKVSDFCYKSSDNTNYTIYQIPDFNVPASWVNNNVPDNYRNCPCNQPNEALTSCYNNGNWIHQDDTTGFNVYAAYYILQTYGLNYEKLLSYFVGDFDYRTTKDPNQTATQDQKPTSTFCSSFDLFSTSLSRSEFVDGLKNYHGNTNLGFLKFQQNAEKIYDIATANGINPEFIVVRAISEGFSPDSTAHNYNYWGVGCNNTNPQCKSYSSFDSAILEYATYLKSTYSSMEDLLKRYAYLGKYWYNPGSWSLGGCVYKNYVYPDGVPSEIEAACSPSNSCNANGEGNCLATTETDQLNYGKYQSREMTKNRKAIWGLDENDCSTTSNGNCKIFKQNDPVWGSDYLLNSPSGSTLGSAGCALTSVSIAMTCSGKLKDPDNFTPRVLNNALKPYASSGGFEWTNSNWAQVIDNLAPGFKHTYHGYLQGSASDKIKTLAMAKTPNNQIVLWLSNAQHATHFVVYQTSDLQTGKVTTMDPAGGVINTYDANDFKEYHIYE